MYDGMETIKTAARETYKVREHELGMWSMLYASYSCVAQRRCSMWFVAQRKCLWINLRHHRISCEVPETRDNKKCANICTTQIKSIKSKTHFYRWNQKLMSFVRQWVANESDSTIPNLAPFNRCTTIHFMIHFVARFIRTQSVCAEKTQHWKVKWNKRKGI